MPVNQKKLLERYGEVKAALKVAMQFVEDAEKELGEIPAPPIKNKGFSAEEKIRIRAQINKNRQNYTYR